MFGGMRKRAQREMQLYQAIRHSVRVPPPHQQERSHAMRGFFLDGIIPSRKKEDPISRTCRPEGIGPSVAGAIFRGLFRFREVFLRRMQATPGFVRKRLSDPHSSDRSSGRYGYGGFRVSAMATSRGRTRHSDPRRVRSGCARRCRRTGNKAVGTAAQAPCTGRHARVRGRRS